MATKMSWAREGERVRHKDGGMGTIREVLYWSALVRMDGSFRNQLWSLEVLDRDFEPTNPITILTKIIE